MNTDDIAKALSSCKPPFIGVYSADNLPEALQSGSILICNTDPEHLPGRHWIAVYLSQEEGEYFDSYGREPSKHFAQYLNKHCRRWTYSMRQIQSAASSFCGQFCVCYVKLRCTRVISSFTCDTGLNDVLVHRIVCS
jgi:hypothetical protein